MINPIFHSTQMVKLTNDKSLLLFFNLSSCLSVIMKIMYLLQVYDCPDSDSGKK